MEKKRLSRILGKCDREVLQQLAEPLMQKYSVKILRKPAKTMVMIRMKETVAKADFYMGELLACEAMVEIEGQKGFALMAGDDLDRVLYAAVVDGILKTDESCCEEIYRVLEEEERKILEREQLEIKMHRATQVKFETMSEDM